MLKNYLIPSKKILFMPDTVNSLDSGAHSARATLDCLHKLNYKVAVYAMDVTKNSPWDECQSIKMYKIPTNLRWYEFIYSPVLMRDFIKILEEFQPDYIFFTGSIQKPAIMAKEARKRGIKVVYLFYINDYFCQSIYAGLDSGPCTECISKSRISALKNGCISYYKILDWIKSELTRFILGREIRKCYKFLGYGKDQLLIARQFGIKAEKLSLIGFQFSPKDLQSTIIKDSGYFALTGSSIMQKGWHLLSSIFSKLDSQIRIKISFKDLSTAEWAINKYNLTCFVDSGLLEIVTGLNDRQRYLDFLASSRAVLLPSYYPTTGEFVLQESMFFQKPVHVFEVGVHKDILINGYNAMTSSIGNMDDYAHKINLIDKDKNLRLMVGKNAYITSKSFYDTESLNLLKNVFL
jgi:glycosyltransferase involved in cell wall biosynthesis